MCLAGGYGADVALPENEPLLAKESVQANHAVSVVEKGLPDEIVLFSESNTRFLLEVPPEAESEIRRLFADLPWCVLGTVSDAPRLTIFDSQRRHRLVDVPVEELKTAWKHALSEKLS
jgi:phosphoribosylformylglycinamidine synthase